MIQIIGPPLSQWDNGRSIEASGSTATHAHFANRGDSYAVIMELVDGKTKIPDYLLQTGKDLCVYLVLDRVTQESKTFSVRKREKPKNYVYEDDQRNYIKELIEDAKAATNAANQVAQDLLKAKENGEFNGKDAEGVDLSDYYTKAEADQKLQQYMSPVLPTLQSHDESITALNGEVGDISSALASTVKSVNDQSPDENGNVQIEVGSGQSSPTYTFRNLLNPNDENYEAGAYVNPTTGKTATNASYNTSGYIEVNQGDRICTTKFSSAAYYQYRDIVPIIWCAYYDENKNVVKGNGKNSGENIYLLIPANVRYVRISMATAYSNSNMMIEKMTCVGICDEYLEYGEEKTVAAPSVDNKDGMFLPPYIYAVRGRSFDIYTAAMFGDAQNLNRIERIGYTASGFGTTQMSNRRIRINPTGTQNSQPLQFKVKNAEGVTVLSAVTNIMTKDGSTATKRIVAIGDSLTDRKPWIAELMRLNPNYTFVGGIDGSAKDSTGTTHTFKHEGRSGWRAEQYYTGYAAGAGNCFWDATNGKFSFSYYVANTLNGTAPDIVILFLGMNDMERNIDAAVNYEKLMVDNIRSSYPNMPIVICAPQARDYNGEGHVAKNGFLMMKKLYEAFALYQNLYFVPLYLIHDSEYNYCLADEYEGVNLYSTITKNKVTDTVHPQNAGYFQFADAIYGALSAIG